MTVTIFYEWRMQPDEEEYRKRVEGYTVGDLADILRNMNREAYPIRYEIASQAMAAKQGLPEADVEASEAVEVSGIGGWLILPIIGLIISPFFLIHKLGSTLSAITNVRVVAVMTDPTSPAYFPHFNLLFGAEMTYNLVMLLLVVWTLWNTFTKKRRTPGLFVFVYVAGAVALTAEYLFYRIAIHPLYAEVGHAVLKETIKSLVVAVIWIPYFIKSKRVANTFVR